MSKFSRSKPFYLVTYLILRFIASLSSIGPLSWVNTKGKILGWLYRTIDNKHYKRTIENLSISFPEKNKNEIIKIAKDNYISLGISIIELFNLNKIYKKYKNKVRFINKDLINQALAKGNGVIIATGHISNWELTGLLSALDGLPFNAIARPIDNPYLNIWINKIRQKFGGNIISKWGAVKGSLKALKKGEIVTVLMDQDAGKEGIMSMFFGRKASTIPLVPLLAQRTKAPILIAYGNREIDGSYTIIIEKEIPLDLTTSRKETLAKTTHLCTKALEDIIRKKPSIWLWMHRRWKTQNDQKL